MDKVFLPATQFMVLTPSLLISTLFELCYSIEKNWVDETIKTSLLQLLKQYCEALDSHKNEEIRKLFILSHKIKLDMDYKSYLAIFTPIERIWKRTCRDDEIVVLKSDAEQSKAPLMPVFFLLDNIRSAYNVGSFFRVGECFGVQKIYLCGYTSTPDDQKTLKTTMNTHLDVDWEWVQSLEDLIVLLQQQGIKIFALETVEEAINLENFQAPFPAAYIFGNEKFGISPHILQMCDGIVKIALSGKKNSLNVSVSAGIVANHLRQQFDR